MPLVLDASVTLSWAFPDEHHPLADRVEQFLRTAEESAVVPVLWWYEVRNALLVSERRGRTTPDRTSLFLEGLNHLNIQISTSPESPSLIDLARSHRLSIYDASYLALAARERLPLATLDGALSAAAIALKVPLFQ
jgi:predicted nucleic acid-binding protein